jgi:hypothetical protein
VIPLLHSSTNSPVSSFASESKVPAAMLKHYAVVLEDAAAHKERKKWKTPNLVPLSRSPKAAVSGRHQEIDQIVPQTPDKRSYLVPPELQVLEEQQ